MAKAKKTPRPKAETPKGFRDYFGSDVTERADMLRKIAEVYHRYGFDALESSAVETVEALGKFLPDVDRPNEGVFAWQEEDDGTWLALRYDMTAPLARVYAQHRNDLPTPYRRYTMGPVWRNEKPGPGRFRQFYQCDADTVGTASMAADAEICALLADTLEAVGIPRGDYVIRVNNRKVLNGVLEGMGLEDEAKRADVLRTIDKFDKIGASGVAELLGQGRRDASGAYIDGVGLSDDQAAPVLAYISAKSRVLDRIEREAESYSTDDSPEYRALVSAWSVERGPDRQRNFAHTAESGKLMTNRLLGYLGELVASSEEGRQGIRELREISDLLLAGGYGPDRVVIDPSVVRGLGYYTGPVYEAELTFDVQNEKGQTVQFGSVAGGGRYDDLVKRFTGQAVPATGVSIGVDRLLTALRSKDRVGTAAQGPVVVTVMDRDRMADYQTMVAELRNANIRAEVYLGNPKNFGNQMKYADRRGSPIAVIEGADEHAAGKVQLKDLILGAQIAQNATLEEWKDRPSQIEVDRSDFVAQVQAMLERQGNG